MSVISRIVGWVTGRDELPPPPQLPSVVAPDPTSVETVSLSFADPAVESLCRFMVKDAHSSTSAAVQARAAGMQVAESQTGLPGIALALADLSKHPDEKAKLAEGAVGFLKSQNVEGNWTFGETLAASSRFGIPRFAALQATLAAPTGPLAAIAVHALAQIPSNYDSQKSDMARAALEQIPGSNSKLALEAAGTSNYTIPRLAIFETFLASPDGDPVQLALASLDKIPSNYASQRADAAHAFVEQMASGKPALQMALKSAQTSNYQIPRRIILEAGLENHNVEKPEELAALSLAMTRAIPSNYASQRVDAGTAMLECLRESPATRPLAELALEMVGTCNYAPPNAATIDHFLQTMTRGGTAAEAVRDALGAIPANYSSQAADAGEAAMRKMKSDPVIELALAAMGSSNFAPPRLAVAKVALDLLVADERPPLAEVALKILDAYPGNYISQAADAGEAMAGRLAARYSAGRDALDRARAGSNFANERLARFRQAFHDLKGVDDDRTSIIKMADGLAGKGPPPAIVQKEDAIIVGGIRVKVRASDATGPMR